MRIRIAHLAVVARMPFNELGCRIGYISAELWHDWRDFVVCIQWIDLCIVVAV